MTIKRYKIIILLFVLGNLFLFSCTQNSPYKLKSQGQATQIVFNYLGKVNAVAIDSVTLTILLKGDTLEQKGYNWTGDIVDTLQLEVADSVEFYARAYNDSSTLVYEGNTITAIRDEAAQQVIIDMFAVLILGAELSTGFNPPEAYPLVNETVSVNFKVANVESLFGFTCEIIYDTAILLIDESGFTKGNFMGADAFGFIKVDGDTINIAVTRISGAGGVTGEGTLFNLNFMAVGVGLDTVRISSNNFSMKKEDGSDVDSLGNITIGEMVIDVK